MTTTENMDFQAETQKLLNIIIHSIYTNKEIFLRELISNASDALDKVRFEINRGTEVIEPESNLEIRISTDNENQKISVLDTGIGMSKDDIIANLGTIAQSGTEEFLKQVSEKDANPDNIIGRFGVGFYSVFMVAEEVNIVSQSAYPGTKPVTWTSDGMGGYQIAEIDEQQPRGTRIDISLHKDCQEYADKERLKSIVQRHSNFVSFPIYIDDEQVNTIPALWKESKFNLTQEQYNEFYKFLTYETNDPLETVHIAVDAPVQFNSLLFIPPHSTAQFETYINDYGLDLYVNRVLIQRKNQDLLPQYLGFVQGVVDTEDLPLNLSREAIQENTLIKKINTTITKQILSRLEQVAEKDPERYKTFWTEHSKVFKLGYTDFGNKEKFTELLRFNSSYNQSAEELTSLNEYTQRMKSGQKEIYFLSGPSRENILSNPHLEMFTSKGLEVLFLYEPIDEFILQSIGTYKDYSLTSVEHVDPDNLKDFVTKEGQKEELSQEEGQDFDNLLKKMKDILGDQVTEVRSSQRLNSSPACLVNPEDGMTSQMKKILHVMQKDTSIPKQILEINPNHSLTRNLIKTYKNNPEDDFITNTTNQLFETSLLQAGYLNDPQRLIQRNFNLLENASTWYTELNQL
ncbi:MAG TPA: molecular chaperone HtpG [Desulfohalobiaceae bacterium]|nr:molecular chaperone HtpG [Desulfohalobiaceae bacterium]